jgi:hypothetical protein
MISGQFFGQFILQIEIVRTAITQIYKFFLHVWFLYFFVFYRFSLIKEHLVEFNQLAMANAEGSDNMLNRVMPKDNIGLAALLRTKEAAWDNGEYTRNQSILST